MSLALVLGLAGAAAHHIWGKHTVEEAQRPSWIVFLAVTMAVALVLGVLLGNINFWTHMKPFYTYESLNEYFAVDPTVTRGQELSDAGRIRFKDGAALDLRRSMGFKNYDTYCVAPVSFRNADGSMLKLPAYDFWAVGLDCCSGSMSDFHCGEFDQPVKAGLRVLGSAQQDMFQLAVKQAEAAFTIQAKEPIFLYWSGDATAEMNSFRDDGLKYYLLGMLTHFAWQLLSVVLGAIGFSKLGRY